MPTLAGKAAIVTGAATGIGRAIASALAASGAGVIVNHLDTPEWAEALLGEIESAGGHARCVQGDVCKPMAFYGRDARMTWDVVGGPEMGDPG